MSRKDFPWTVFSANTLRPMMADVFRSGGHPSSLSGRLNKEQSLALLQKIEHHGLETALKDLNVSLNNASASTSKRKHEPNDSSEPPKKRGRARNEPSGPSGERVTTLSAPRTRGSISDPGQGLLTRRKAAQVRGEKVPPMRSWKPATRSPRKASKKNASGVTSGAPRPKSKGQIFDGVEILKRPNSYVGKGKGRAKPETDGDATPESEQEGNSDEDAEGEIVDEVEMSSLENSNKENEATFLEIANADDTDADDEDIIPTEEIGSPAPQITIEPTDDQIEEGRNHDVSIEIGSPAPEITIEPIADDGDMEDQIEFEENGHLERGALLRPRISTLPDILLLTHY
ncbi:hypothetical protein C8R43DRAFT_1036869 [Mycena crocata]|nr:hypothetical protein C8R43DRAFT_1036869 [Mycena crocata]